VKYEDHKNFILNNDVVNCALKMGITLVYAWITAYFFSGHM